MNVFENIAFGLRLKKTPENIIKEKVAEALKMVQLSGYETVKSHKCLVDNNSV